MSHDEKSGHVNKNSPRKPLPRALSVEEVDEEERLFEGLCHHSQYMVRGGGDGHPIVGRVGGEGRDEQGGVPGVAAALGPHKVQRLQLCDRKEFFFC